MTAIAHSLTCSCEIVTDNNNSVDHVTAALRWLWLPPSLPHQASWCHLHGRVKHLCS
ncbi:hypothetical protein J6590_008374 [Homalodisca vitripennis]|nr:hypothetical protein J6590_008374 [Homalodisca vitripennis]